MKNSLISICIPTYNGETTIKETLDSILRQITSEFVIIISDDQSKDSSFYIAQECAEKFAAVRAFRNEENTGMDRNFHQCVKYSRGKYRPVLCEGS